MDLPGGLDASGRKGKVKNISYSILHQKYTPPQFINGSVDHLKPQPLILSEWIQGKGVYQFVDKYGANVDGYRYCSSFHMVVPSHAIVVPRAQH